MMFEEDCKVLQWESRFGIGKSKGEMNINNLGIMYL